MPMNQMTEKLLARIGEGKKVLLISAEAEKTAELLRREKHCEVFPVPVDKDRFEIADGKIPEGFGDYFESYEWKTACNGQTYDHIIFVQGLEYIYDPKTALEVTSCYLTESGSAILVVPNIGHDSVMLELLKKQYYAKMAGRTEFSQTTHYTFNGLEMLYSKAGYKPAYLDAVCEAYESREADFSENFISPAMAEELKERSFGDVKYYIADLRRSNFFDWTRMTTENHLEAMQNAATGLLQVLEEQMAEEEARIGLYKKEVFEKRIHIENLNSMNLQKDATISAIQPAYNEYLVLRDSSWVKLRQKMPDALAKRAINKLRHKEFETCAVPCAAAPKVSIVIPVYNQFNYTYNCVKSIVDTVRDIPYEVIIGDDMSTDATRKITKILPGVRVNINKTDHGFVMNCNRAAALAKGQYLVFLNNDTVVRENWLSSLAAVLDKDSKAGMVGSKLLYDEERCQEAGGIIWSDATGWNYGREQTKFGPEVNYLKEVDYVSGASLMIRKSLWDDIGGFDERFIPAYYEDTDLAFSVRKLGYKVMFQPRSEVFHFEGISNGTDTAGTGLKAYQVTNHDKFAEKWAEELTCQYPDPSYLFPARERGQNKKTVLFIDHYVPTIDKDAGSKSTFSYIRIFLHMGYSVKFIGDNFNNPEPYTSILQDLGVEVIYGLWYEQNWQNWLKENGKFIDIVFCNRPHITIKYIDILKKLTQAQIIYYGHDLHYVRTLREYELSKDEELYKEAQYWKSIEYSIMEKADTVFYPSYVEINTITKENKDLDGRAYAIPVYMYEEPHDYQILPAKEKKDILFVGGFAHSPNIDAALWFVKDILPQILKVHPDLVFHIVGSRPTEEIKALACDNVIVHGFVSDEELIDLYHQMRIVIAPLRYGAGMKGKIVEALYYQAPVVTTSIGAEGMPEPDDVLIVEDDGDKTAQILNDLYEDYDRLDAMAAATKPYIEKYFSENAASAIVKGILR